MSDVHVDVERYSRQIPVLGKEGQERLARATVVVAGLGGLGSPVAYYLAAAGVGKMVLVDEGDVELSNLNRQIIYRHSDVGKSKVEIAAVRLSQLNPEVLIKPLKLRISEDNVGSIVKGADVVVDCLDNFGTRYVLAEATWDEGAPLVHGAIEGTYGQVTTIVPGVTPRLKEVFPRVRDRTGIPVIGATAGVVGAIEAMEAIKFITSVGRPLTNRLLIIDLSDCSFEVVSIAR